MRSIDKHKKIIRAATKVFAQKGFFNARISDIAKEAKIADGTIYLYFKNKFDILISVFEEEIGKLIEQTTVLLEQEPEPQKKLEIFIAKHLEEMKKNRHLAEVIHIELRQTHKLIKEYRKKVFSKYLNILANIIREGQRKNIFRKDVSPELVKQIIFGSLDEISRIWGISNETEREEISLAEVNTQLTKLFLRGLLISEEHHNS
ncbi:MAG: TetR family transcriptional regulator [Desulfobulbus propionicus]|nr:MAG: TetR family transcriptional regulator [Desulfobulbus propionicus]